MALPGNVVVPFSPYQLRTESRGFEALAQLHASLGPIQGAKIAIDCSKLFWFDGHLAAPFRTVIEHSKARGNILALSGLNADVKLVLQKNGLLRDRAADAFHTTMPVTKFRLDEEVKFSQYSRHHLAREEMPKMTASLRNKFFEAVDELFANCSLHSKSPVDVIAAGQFYPRMHRLAFSISDGGRGVDGSLRDAGIKYKTAAEAIDWAMRATNTTRQGDIPGGLGLKLLREFVAMNRGKLLLVSGNGWWCQNGDAVVKSQLRSPFPGTAVVLEIQTSDPNRYDLARSTSNENIW